MHGDADQLSQHARKRCSRAEGPSIYWISQALSVPNLQLHPIIYMELFHRAMQQIALKSNK